MVEVLLWIYGTTVVLLFIGQAILWEPSRDQLRPQPFVMLMKALAWPAYVLCAMVLVLVILISGVNGDPWP